MATITYRQDGKAFTHECPEREVQRIVNVLVADGALAVQVILPERTFPDVVLTKE